MESGGPVQLMDHSMASLECLKGKKLMLVSCHSPSPFIGPKLLIIRWLLATFRKPIEISSLSHLAISNPSGVLFTTSQTTLPSIGQCMKVPSDREPG